MMTQRQPVTSTTQERPAKQPQRLHTAGAGRGSNHNRRPVCIFPYPPECSDQQVKARCIRSQLDQVVQALDRWRISASGGDDGDEGLCGGVTLSPIPFAPRGGAAASVPVVQQAQQLQEAGTWQ